MTGERFAKFPAFLIWKEERYFCCRRLKESEQSEASGRFWLCDLRSRRSLRRYWKYKEEISTRPESRR